MAFVRATVALATVAGTITAPILLLALLQLWWFFPQFRNFRASLGSSVLLRNFSFYS